MAGLQERSYNIGEAAINVRVDREQQSYLDDYIVSVSRRLAEGNKIKSLTKTVRSIEKRIQIPATPWDAIKDLLVKWIPSLNFGWLKSRYTWIETQITENNHYSIRNVYPVTDEMRGRLHMAFYKAPVFTTVCERIPEPIDWLESEPFDEETMDEFLLELKRFNHYNSGYREIPDRRIY